MSTARKPAKVSIAVSTTLANIRFQMLPSIGGKIAGLWSVSANTGSDTLTLTKSCEMKQDGFMVAMDAVQNNKQIN